MDTLTLIAVAALVPSATLIGLALWIYFTQTEPLDEFLADQDDWGDL